MLSLMAGKIPHRMMPTVAQPGRGTRVARDVTVTGGNLPFGSIEGLVARRPTKASMTFASRGACDRSYQFLGLHRLLEVGSGATRQTRSQLVVRSERRQKHNWRSLRQHRQERQEVEVGNADVENDRVEAHVVHDPERVAARACLGDVVARHPQDVRHRAPRVCGLVDDQYGNRVRARSARQGSDEATSSRPVPHFPASASVRLFLGFWFLGFWRLGSWHLPAPVRETVRDPLPDRETGGMRGACGVRTTALCVAPIPFSARSVVMPPEQRTRDCAVPVGSTTGGRR